MKAEFYFRKYIIKDYNNFFDQQNSDNYEFIMNDNFDHRE